MAANRTRNVFFSQIGHLMQNNKEIVIVSVDLAGPPFDEIRRNFPEQYVSVGIAEQNAVAVACGMASVGKKVLVYAANPFPLLRGFDQIRNGACMMQLPIVIVGLGTGFSVSECGSTHFALEDIALASLCQGLDIYSVSDTKLANELANHIFDLKKPTYLRFGKWAEEELSEETIDLEKGYRKVYGHGRIAIVSTGCTTKWIKSLGLCEDEITVFDWYKISENKAIFEELTKNYKAVITVEEQLLRGGIGSILLETANKEKNGIPVSRIGLEMGEGYPQTYGNREYWLNKYGVTKEEIEKRIADVDGECSGIEIIVAKGDRE